MCPACLTAATLVTLGATSTGGLAVYATMKIKSRKQQQSLNQGEGAKDE